MRSESTLQDFLNSLPQEELNESKHSMIVSSQHPIMGAATNAGNCGSCQNELASQCNTTNAKNCVNYNGVCYSSINRGICINKRKVNYTIPCEN